MEWALMDDVEFDGVDPMGDAETDFGTPIMNTNVIDLIWWDENDALMQ